MKKLLLIIFCLTVLGVGCEQKKNSNVPSSDRTITVGNQKVFVEVMDTPAKKQLGLSYRKSLPEQSGLLFDFSNDTTKRPGFWMKEMLFPIDIIWIRNNQVVEITKNVPAPKTGTQDRDLPIYSPASDIDYVLEVNAGWSDKYKIQPGDKVQL